MGDIEERGRRTHILCWFLYDSTSDSFLETTLGCAR